MEFVYVGEWNETTKGLCVVYIRDTLTEIQGTPPDDLFIEYITTMIMNKKNMAEIAKELADFFGETESSEFASSLGLFLQNINSKNSSDSSSAASKPIASEATTSKPISKAESAPSSSRQINLKSTAVPLQALRSTRGNVASTATVTSNGGPSAKAAVPASGGRLLQTAIKSSTKTEIDQKLSTALSTSRTGPNPEESRKRKAGPASDGEGAQRSQRTAGNSTAGRSVTSRLGGTAEVGAATTQSNTPVNSNDNSGMLERMQQMAQLWGFRSAEEMMQAQQLTMMQMMANFAPNGFGGPPGPHGLHGRPPFPPFAPHPQNTFGGYHGGRNSWRGGRGAGGRFSQSYDSSSDDPTATQVGAETSNVEGSGNEVGVEPSDGSSSVAGRGYGRGYGRGFSSARGRAGRFSGRFASYNQPQDSTNPTNNIGSSEAANAPAEPASSSGNTDSNAAATAVPGDGSGRGGFIPRGGRGGRFVEGRASNRGRGRGPVFPNKSWVREPTMSESLVTGR